MKKYTNLSLLLVMAYLFAGCAGTQYLNDYKSAQEAFNRASAAGNQQMMNPEAVLVNSPESDYRTARAFIMKAMGDTPNNSQPEHTKTKLASDGLLLTAYNIRALSEWKLGMYDAALQTANACRMSFANDASVKEQRDYVVMEVMQALIYNDSIADYLQTLDPNRQKEEPSATEISYFGLLNKSMDIIKEQRMKLDADHPLQTYLCITQLSVAKNWKDLVMGVRKQMKNQRSPKLPTWNAEWKAQRKGINQQLAGVFADLKKLLPEESMGIYETWKKAHIDVAGI